MLVYYILFIYIYIYIYNELILLSNVFKQITFLTLHMVTLEGGLFNIGFLNAHKLHIKVFSVCCVLFMLYILVFNVYIV